MGDYVYYCQWYWKQKKQQKLNYNLHIILQKKYDNTLLIDTTLSITSIYAFFHPISPKPTRYKQFLFTMICEENLIRSRTFFR